MKKLILIAILCIPFLSISQEIKKEITLEDIFQNRKFSSRSGGIMKPAADGKYFYQYKKDSINIYEYETGKYSGTVVTAPAMIPEGGKDPVDISSFEFSADESRILFETDVEPIYRYSTISAYYVYDRKNHVLSPLSGNGKQRLAAFSPDGTKVAFVRENNLFVAFIDDSGKIKEEKQITTDGKINSIINGATDWVYEEEFGFSSAFSWSPDSKKLAYYRFDESNVKEYQLTYYGDLYPERYKYKYPKAGENNSVISLFVADPSAGKVIQINTGSDTNIYIPRMKWTNDPSIVSFYRMNRHQNKLELLFADASTGSSKTIYTEENKYYIDINDDLTYLKDNKGFLLTSEKDGYNHIYRYDMDGKLLNQITSGNWDVREIAGVDYKSGNIFYLSTEISPLQKDLYSIGLDGKKKTRITAGKGMNYILFNSDYTFFVNRQSQISAVPIISVNNAKGERIRVIQDNAALVKTMGEYKTSVPELFSFKTSEGVELNAWMLKPPDFNPAKKYPVLFCIYGGPGVQTVQNAWGMVSMWNQYLASKGIIIFSVDNRGTYRGGEEFRKMTYLNLGKYETIDQIEAAKYLSGLPYVDSRHIGMWGWSFGGYLTLSCLTKGADYFSMGVAVAPVTNWRYYDDIYTERYMRTPQENPAGYDSNSPVNHTDLFKGKLLLIHGMADDNVHPQNSIDFISAMVASGKQFDMQFYPNSNHGIYTGKNTTMHLYRRMSEFIIDNLTKKE